MPRLTHLDSRGKARMVDVSEKRSTSREAVAKGIIHMQPATYKLLKRGEVAKGDALTVAQIAGIMGAKQTPHLIPLCHPLLLSNIKVEFTLNDKDSSVEITATVKNSGQTGVEMEAMTAVAVSALTIYDMCKGVDRGMRIDAVRMVRKSGGKSGNIELP